MLLPPYSPDLKPIEESFAILKKKRLFDEYQSTVKQLIMCNSSLDWLYHDSERNKTLTYSDKQFYSASTDHCRDLSRPLASGTVLQMDQTKSAHQVIFRYIGKCGQNADMDRNINLRSGRHHQKTAWIGGQSLHNPTDFECDHFWKNTVNSNGCRRRQQFKGWDAL